MLLASRGIGSPADVVFRESQGVNSSHDQTHQFRRSAAFRGHVHVR